MRGRALLLLALFVGVAAAQDDELRPVVPADPRRELEEARAEEKGVLNQLDAIDRSLFGMQEQMGELEDRVAEVEAGRTRHQDELASAEAVLDAQRGQVAARVSALYRLHRRGLARIVFGAEDPAELRRRSKYLLAIIQADLRRLESFAGAASKKRTAVSAIDSDVASISALRAELQLKEADLRDQRARRVSLLDDIRTRRVLAMRALSEYASNGRELGERIAMTGSAWNTSSTLGSQPGNFRDAYGRLPWPTTGRLVRRFGSYVDPHTGAQGDSLGIDIAAAYGTPFRAVFDGTVSLAEHIAGYGQTVVVEHGAYSTVYAHANGMQVRKGQQVRAGDVLGNVGNTGLTDGDGYQLSFEILYNGTRQDPLPWLMPR